MTNPNPRVFRDGRFLANHHVQKKLFSKEECEDLQEGARQDRHERCGGDAFAPAFERGVGQHGLVAPRRWNRSRRRCHGSGASLEQPVQGRPGRTYRPLAYRVVVWASSNSRRLTGFRLSP